MRPTDVEAIGFDAIVLAGGRSSRMDGIDKVSLVVAGRSLLQHACAATQGACRLVVVGPDGLAGVPSHAVTVREDPPFSGPAAAIGAGLTALDDAADLVLVLAADVPRAGEVVPLLLAAVSTRGDGVVARSSDGHRQPLLAVYRVEPLRQALAAHEPLTDLGVARVTRGMDLTALDIADDLLADIDTPADLALTWRGASAFSQSPSPGRAQSVTRT